MKLNHVFKHIVVFIDAIEEFIVYFLQLCFYDKVRNFIKKGTYSKPLDILVNGPSLNDSLVEIINGKLYETHEIMTVNFLTNEDCFYTLKPRYHVISDVQLFLKSEGYEDKVKSFVDCLNTKVDWEMTLFVTYGLYRNKNWRNKFYNNNIEIVPLHTIAAPRNKKVSCFFATRGLLGANYGSVLHHAIYAGILMGYKTICLYGADHTFFNGLFVNHDNQVCKRTEHFYDDQSEIKPIYHLCTGERRPYTMSFFMWEYERVFLGHDIMRYISDKMGCKIINKSKISLIDSYIRE